MKGFRLCALGALFAGTSVTYAAGPFWAAEAYNAILLGSLTASGGDTEGRLLVVGDASFTASYSVAQAVIGTDLPNSSTRDDLVVGGTMTNTGSNWSVRGNAVYGTGYVGTAVTFVSPGAGLRQQDPVTLDPATGNAVGGGTTLAALTAQLEAASASWATEADRGVVVRSLEFSTLTLTGNDPQLNIFNITAAEFSSPSLTIAVTAPVGASVLINVSGESVTRQFGSMVLTGVTREGVVVNFPTANTLNLTGFAMEGSVVATQTETVSFSGGAINGQAVLGGAVNQANGFEFHNFRFTGIIPEPSTVGGILGAVALVVAGFVRRRRGA